MVQHCDACNTTKALTEFTASTRHKSGYYPMCRDCKNAERKRQEMEPKKPYEKKEGTVPAPTHATFKDTFYVPARDNPEGYLRNTGNKQYKSKGTLC